jgi:alkanesulfonate monooxygenase SsuD/methylene tetrahydromethanopterin reductase-like flavin-dependent oxidoreductase (luciferase family)
MRVGMILPRNEPGGGPLTSSSLPDGARQIERAGFDGIWVFDALNRGFILPDPLTALAVAGTVTDRVELGTCILQLGIRQPVEVVHRVMTTHLICGDRLSLGVGAGSTKDDFLACGASYEDRFATFAASVDLLRTIFRGDPVPGVDLTPWPAVAGGPRMLIGAWAGSAWIERAAQEFDGWICSAAKGGRLAEGITHYRACGGTRAIVTNITVDLGGPEEPLAEGAPFGLVCGPRQARERLTRLADLGFDDVILRTAEHTDRHLEAIRALVP